MGHLESSFEVMEPADLLQWLRTARKTGVCRFQNQAAVRRVYLEDGRIVACTANEPHLLLGQFLIANGRIDAAALRACMKLQEESGLKLGSLLVSTGKISETELKRLIHAKAEETVFGLFDWPEASFRFDPDQSPPDDAMRVDLDIEAVLFEGIRRRDEMDQARELFPSRNVVLHRTDRRPDPPTVASYMGQQLYETVNGTRTLAEIILLCRVSEYLAYSFLARLVERGLVRVGEARESDVDVESAHRRVAIEELRDLVAHGEYEEALELANLHGLTTGGDDFSSMLVAKAEAGFLARTYRTQVPPDSVPRRTRGHDAPENPEGLTSEELLLLDFVEGKWDVRSLVWISPMRKVDVVRALVRLERAGYIEFRSKATGLEPLDERSDDDNDTMGGKDTELAVGEALENVLGG